MYLQSAQLYSHNTGSDAVAHIKIVLAMLLDGPLPPGDWYSRNNPAQYGVGQAAPTHRIDEMAGRTLLTLNRKA